MEIVSPTFLLAGDASDFTVNGDSAPNDKRSLQRVDRSDQHPGKARNDENTRLYRRGAFMVDFHRVNPTERGCVQSPLGRTHAAYRARR